MFNCFYFRSVKIQNLMREDGKKTLKKKKLSLFFEKLMRATKKKTLDKFLEKLMRTTT